MKQKFGASGGLGGGTMNNPNSKMVGIGSDPNYDPSRTGSGMEDLVEIGQKGMQYLASSIAGLQVRFNLSFSSPFPSYCELMCIELTAL